MFQQRGFTLIEVVVAVLVFSLVTAAIVQLYNNGYFAIMSSGTRTKAIYAIQSELEAEIREVQITGTPKTPAQEETLVFSLIGGGGDQFTVDGYLINKEEPISSRSGQTISLSVFVPVGSDDND